MSERSVYQLFKKIASEQADKVAYSYKSGDSWIEKTWTQTEADCKQISKALIALGVEHGEKVNILSNTRYEWVALDFGIVSVGAATVGIYASNLAEDCAYIINHSDAKVIFVENQDQLDKVITVKHQLEKIEHIVLIDGAAKDPDSAMSWDVFIAKAKETTDATFTERAEKIDKSDLAALV